MDYILSIVTLACINMIAVLGLSIFTGFTGLFSFGHAAFVGVGAYTSAVLTYYYPVPFPLALAAGAAAAGAVSLVIGVPTLRAKLRSDYFAIAILGFGEAGDYPWIRAVETGKGEDYAWWAEALQ